MPSSRLTNLAHKRTPWPGPSQGRSRTKRCCMKMLPEQPSMPSTCFHSPCALDHGTRLVCSECTPSWSGDVGSRMQHETDHKRTPWPGPALGQSRTKHCCTGMLHQQASMPSTCCRSPCALDHGKRLDCSECNPSSLGGVGSRMQPVLKSASAVALIHKCTP